MMDSIEEYATNLIKKVVPAEYCFHNADHTTDVVKAVKIICLKQNIEELDLNILLTAAWFHDTGIVGGYDNHEMRSQKIATEFLIMNGLNNNYIQSVNECINATKLPQQPKNNLESILCDADMYHLSQPDYWIKNELLRIELKNRKINIPYKVWLCQNLSFLEGHRYFTTYGNKVLEPLKQKHLQENITKIEKCK